MMVMTAKVNVKKILIGLVAAVAVILLLILLLSGKNDSQPTGTSTVSGNDARVEFLKNYGWEVVTSPVESGQVRIPKDESQVFSRYNELQKSQGYDLSQYAGEAVMRYVYQVENYPGATDPVYATVLVYKNQVIGGDVTNTGATGVVQSFQFPKTVTPQPTDKPTESTAPSGE